MPATKHTAAELIGALGEARGRTLALVQDLNDEELMGPRLPIVNPMRWEIGHVAWFNEYWVLRHFLGDQPILANEDVLYNSATVAHDTRWELPLPSRHGTLEYMQRVLDAIEERRPELEARGARDGYDGQYFLELVLLHEGMHDEAFTYTRQTLGFPAPQFPNASGPNGSIARSPIKTRDASIPGGTLYLGSTSDQPFVFDNEQWAHPVEVKPFAISRTAVSNAEFRGFVEEGGYRRREFWTEAGWWWRNATGAEHPVYWQADGNRQWLRRNFDQWVGLEADLPVLHVTWYEADAYCRWAGRRLPTEAEWELAATAEPDGQGNRASKRIYPWGDEPPTPARANLDWAAMGVMPVTALPDGDSAFGCRQMIGNTWEWTASDFGPFPGFSAGPYKEYSQPWFSGHKVLRGGCWATRPRLIRSAYRNFYPPDRRDVWAGFRTCALNG